MHNKISFYILVGAIALWVRSNASPFIFGPWLCSPYDEEMNRPEAHRSNKLLKRLVPLVWHTECCFVLLSFQVSFTLMFTN